MKTLIVTQAEYVNAKEIMEKLQRLPRKAQRAILYMLDGAVVISEMYRDAGTDDQPLAQQDSA